MDSKGYYLISPTVNGKPKDIDSFLNKMFQQKIVMMGWGNNDNLGKKFGEIRKGDFVIVAKRNNFIFKYYFAGIVDDNGNTDAEGFQYRKLKHFVDLRESRTDYLKGISFYNQQTIKALMRILDPEKIVIMNGIIKKSIEKEHLEKIMLLLKANHNIILTGAPGTGKTYMAKQVAEQLISKVVHSTPLDILKQAVDNFKKKSKKNPSYENLRTDFINRFPKEKLKEMTLDDYCIGKGDENKDNFCYWIEIKLKALGYYFPGNSKSYLIYWDKDEEEYVIAGYLKDQTETDPKSLMKILANDISNLVESDNPSSFTNKFGESFILKVLNSYYPEEYAPINSKTHIDTIISLFGISCDSNDFIVRNKAVNLFFHKQCKENGISSFELMHILYDNFNIKEGEIKKDNGELILDGGCVQIQFHPSYDYTDFVEGLRPFQDTNRNIGFERKDGAFKTLCVTALKNPNKNYVMIIDEINRGEISKIFGELFFSIDPDYRGTKGDVRTQYANMQTSPNAFDDTLGIIEPKNYGHFFVPENVYIIGTMNDIDRSVESMDFAFRRRFAFQEITAKESQKMLEDEEAWGKDNEGKSRKPVNDIQTIKDKMDALNNLIWHNAKEGEPEDAKCIEGLSSAYHIGASYFLKLVNYKKEDGSFDYDKLWEYHLEGLLREYMRGMPSVSENIKRLAKAFGYSNMSKYE